MTTATSPATPPATAPARRFDQVTLLLTLPVMLVPVVSFMHGVSPLDTVTAFLRNLLENKDAAHHYKGELVHFGAPMLIGWMVLAARWRLYDSNRIESWLRVSAWLAASASISTTTWLVVWNASVSSWHEFFAWLFPLITTLLGVALLVRRWLRQGRTHRDVVVALEVAFTAHALLLVTLAFGSGQIGWWLTLACLLGIVPDLVSARVRPSHP